MPSIFQPPQDGGGYRREKSPVDSISPAQAGGSEILAFTLSKTHYRLGYRASPSGTEYFAEREDEGKWATLLPGQFCSLEKELAAEMRMVERGIDTNRLMVNSPYDIFQSRLEDLLGNHSRHILEALGDKPEAKDTLQAAGSMIQVGLTRALKNTGFKVDVSGVPGMLDEAVAHEWMGIAERQYPTDATMFGARVCVLTAVQDYAATRLKDRQNPPTVQEIAEWLKDTKTAEETLKRLNCR